MDSAPNVDAAADVTTDAAPLDGAGSDATSETGVDAGPPDTALAPDAASILCPGGPALVNDCMQCPGKNTRCPASNTCVNDCHNNQCAGAPIQCFSCDGANKPVTSSCEPTGAAPCAAVVPRCTCAGGDQNLCAGRYQTCVGNQCLSCGEPATNGVNCKGGSSCSTGNGSDQFSCP